MTPLPLPRSALLAALDLLPTRPRAAAAAVTRQGRKAGGTEGRSEPASGSGSMRHLPDILPRDAERTFGGRLRQKSLHLPQSNAAESRISDPRKILEVAGEDEVAPLRS